MGFFKLLFRLAVVVLVLIVIQNPDILLAGIVFVLLMGVSFIRWIIRHIL